MFCAWLNTLALPKGVLDNVSKRKNNVDSTDRDYEARHVHFKKIIENKEWSSVDGCNAAMDYATAASTVLVLPDIVLSHSPKEQRLEGGRGTNRLRREGESQRRIGTIPGRLKNGCRSRTLEGYLLEMVPSSGCLSCRDEEQHRSKCRLEVPHEYEGSSRCGCNCDISCACTIWCQLTPAELPLRWSPRGLRPCDESLYVARTIGASLRHVGDEFQSLHQKKAWNRHQIFRLDFLVAAEQQLALAFLLLAINTKTKLWKNN